jgi:hypothetical protein
LEATFEAVRGMWGGRPDLDDFTRGRRGEWERRLERGYQKDSCEKGSWTFSPGRLALAGRCPKRMELCQVPNFRLIDRGQLD